MALGCGKRNLKHIRQHRLVGNSSGGGAVGLVGGEVGIGGVGEAEGKGLVSLAQDGVRQGWDGDGGGFAVSINGDGASRAIGGDACRAVVHPRRSSVPCLTPNLIVHDDW